MMINRPLYIFDLDGTLALIDHRRPILEDLDNPHRWDHFYEACDKDAPNLPIIQLYNRLKFDDKNDVYIFSGRSAKVRIKTIRWLTGHIIYFSESEYKNLIMRPINDYTPDEELKKSWYDNMLIDDKERLVCIFDDRDKVVKMWRSLGITCLQVADGNF